MLLYSLHLLALVLFLRLWIKLLDRTVKPEDVSLCSENPLAGGGLVVTRRRLKLNSHCAAVKSLRPQDERIVSTETVVTSETETNINIHLLQRFNNDIHVITGTFMHVINYNILSDT